MAKKDQTPALYVNANRADLNLPDGTIIPASGEIELSGDALDNLGVQMWIEAGLLVPKSAAAPATASDEPAQE